jgi:hypothetical protein
VRDGWQQAQVGQTLFDDLLLINEGNDLHLAGTPRAEQGVGLKGFAPDGMVLRSPGQRWGKVHKGAGGLLD